ncbi:hypothetical protein N7G274_005075 [Stereocaulon virgatum]|uniref:C3H1-type domain-containing protein n=1 Tax=Stereocaulon virgatum TaxID=373712 RepID=A0ABR4AER2_9LECA
MARNNDSTSRYSNTVSRCEITSQLPVDSPATARIYRSQHGNPRRTYNQGDNHTEAFVQVIIDCDCLHFENEWIMGNWSAGRLVAEEIQIDVLEYLNRNDFETRDLSISVYAYANVSKLADHYFQQGFGSSQTFMGFWSGFNSLSSKGCYFEDIGTSGIHWPGGVFLRSLGSHACKRNILANPTISEYRSITETYLSLLEESKRAGIADRLLGLDFDPGIFKTASVGYLWRQVLMETPLSSVPIDSPHSRFHSVLRNRFGQRIDPALEVLNEQMTAVRIDKLCNGFCIRGHCRHQSPCKFQHRLISEQELAALRVIAREAPCMHGTWCRDPSCFFGHNCTQDYSCVRSVCKFSPAMHLLSKEAVNIPSTGLSSISQSADKLPPFSTDANSVHHDVL